MRRGLLLTIFTGELLIAMKPPHSAKPKSLKPFKLKPPYASKGRPTVAPALATATAKSPPSPERHQGKNEEKYHGLRACEALFARRPSDIIRVYIVDQRRRHCARLLEWCASNRRGFQVVEQENLSRISGTIHHEGIAILAREIPRLGTPEFSIALESGRLKGPLLYLDGVHNPHNVGSILRTASHFGVGAVLGARNDLPPLSPAAVRVAEGAAECLPVYALADAAADLERLKGAGFQIVASSSHRGDPVYASPLGSNVVLVLGSEGEGISRPIEGLADRLIQIPGTSVVESLNVSVACGILLSEVWRHPIGPSARVTAGADSAGRKALRADNRGRQRFDTTSPSRARRVRK